MVTHGERVQVLEMLVSGRLTVEQADQLLDALAESGSTHTAAPMVRPDAPEPPVWREARRTGRRPPSSQRGLSRSQLVEFKIHGVTPEYIRAMGEIGLDNLSPERLIELRTHGVAPAYVREMRELELGDLTAERLVELHMHGVTPDYVREMRACGLGHLTVKELLELRIHGVDAGYIQEMHRFDVSSEAHPEEYPWRPRPVQGEQRGQGSDA